MPITRRFIVPIIALSSLAGLGVADDGRQQAQTEIEGLQADERGAMRPPATIDQDIDPRRPGPDTALPSVPRWLEEVRAQRRALHAQRRAAHQARHDALDPIGAAKRDQRREQMRRREEEVRERIETERRLYLNHGPWLSPLIPAPPFPGDDPLAGGSLVDEHPSQAPEAPAPRSDPLAPSDWNNLWYYRGW